MVLKRGIKAAFTDPLIGTSEIFMYFLMGIIMVFLIGFVRDLCRLVAYILGSRRRSAWNSRQNQICV